ncbi:hypothetical protein ACFLQN_02885 [Candidatus Aenigmatarchaeota archaeon]
MIEIEWRFFVKPGRGEEFEALNRPGGKWDLFFREAEGYHGTTLVRRPEDHNPKNTIYFTRDRWKTLRHFELYTQRELATYEELSERNAVLCNGNRKMHVYEVVG